MMKANYQATCARAEDLIAELEQLGVTVWAQEGHLRYKAPQDILTADIKQRLIDNKDRLLALLSERDGTWRDTRPRC
jgi:pyochelin synthetase